jgi:glycosyltransferase involved in cell wall biosynthesis
MHIAAYVNPLTVGRVETGVSKHVRNMVRELARRPGVTLTLLSPRREWARALRQDAAHPFAGLPAALLPGRRSWLEKAWSLVGGPAADRWCRGADWVYCPMEAYVPTARARLAVTVHCMNWFEPDLPWYPAAAADRRRWRLKLRRAFRRDDVLILAVSEFLKGRLADLFDIRPERIAVVGNGVEDAYYRVGGAGRADPPGAKYLLVVGGLTQRKGGAATLRVARALRDRGSDLEVWVAGASEPDLEAAAREHPNVKHLGYRGVDTGLPELLRDSVALLFLSRYDTFGIPAAEAMAAGTPAVVSGYAGLPEVVGSAGLVVDGDRPDDVADRVIRLAADPAWRGEWVARGRRRSLDHTWANCAARLCRALEVGGPVVEPAAAGGG